MRRIANGYRKYVVENPAPYIVNNQEPLLSSSNIMGKPRPGTHGANC